jgi:glycosyltransferase involved in cell wall biosynthesis
MWAFCGAEHYTEEFRWREGYLRDNRPAYESGFDLNRWVWERKRRNWKKPMQIVTPSRWLADCARESALLREWPVNFIPYPIDNTRWQPIEKNLARSILGLPPSIPLLLFGAIGGVKDPRKGFDLLLDALNHLRGEIPNLEVVIFGQSAPRETSYFGFPVHYSGHLNDDVSLRLLYSASDAFALPSRQDNLPLTCIEALSCGLPVVAFNSSGPPSMIEHKRTGYLAQAFDALDFSKGIRWLIEHSERLDLRNSARNYARLKFDPKGIAREYLDIYKKVLSSDRTKLNK